MRLSRTSTIAIGGASCGALLAAMLLAGGPAPAQQPAPVTFYRDVLPILQDHCQECHRPHQMAPMPLTTYEETRPWAKAIRLQVTQRSMPPWHADPCCGHFSNARVLTDAEIGILSAWAGGAAAAGDPADAPPPREWTEGWNLSRVDAVIPLPEPFVVPATRELEYQYLVAPVEFPEDRWVTGVELRPGDRRVVHHAVVYVRKAGDTWTGGPTTNDILTVYAPGSVAEEFPPGMAKLIPAGSSLVFEMHYTPAGEPVEDRTEVGVRFADAPPAKRVITLQMDSTAFRIPAGARDYHVAVWGTVPNDALLLSFFPHMHLRGRAFEYTMVPEDGPPVTLLKVDPYNFYWQLSYRLAEPLPLKKGTRLNWIATYDNSAANPLNPDPDTDVTYGLQSWNEMMVGFFDIAVDAGIDKETYFVR